MKRRFFTPRRHGPDPISPAMAPPAPGSGRSWSTNPQASIVIYRPPCGQTGCREPAMTWQRCRCLIVFARCHLHLPGAEHPPGAPWPSIEDLRAAHPCKVSSP